MWHQQDGKHRKELQGHGLVRHLEVPSKVQNKRYNMTAQPRYLHIRQKQKNVNTAPAQKMYMSCVLQANPCQKPSSWNKRNIAHLLHSIHVTIGVWACPDHLLTGYDYSIRCVTAYQSWTVASVSGSYHVYDSMTHSQDPCTRMSHSQDRYTRVCILQGGALKPSLLRSSELTSVELAIKL